MAVLQAQWFITVRADCQPVSSWMGLALWDTSTKSVCRRFSRCHWNNC